jgi:hypothetical protein
MIALLSLGILAHAYHAARSGLHHFFGFLFLLVALPILLGRRLRNHIIMRLTHDREGK